MLQDSEQMDVAAPLWIHCPGGQGLLPQGNNLEIITSELLYKAKLRSYCLYYPSLILSKK